MDDFVSPGRNRGRKTWSNVELRICRLESWVRRLGGIGLKWGVSHDVLDNITTITDPDPNDPNGNPRDYGYDSVSRMVSVDDPNAGHIDFAYDDVGNLIERLDAKGQRLRNQHGLANRLSLTELFERPSGNSPSFHAA